MNHLRKTVGLVAATALALSLAACSATPSGQTVESADGAFPVTIEHAFGSTTIEAKPVRVATVAWMNHEVPLALGIVPVGMAKATWGDDDGDGVLPWVEDKLTELGAETPVLFDETDGIDFEAVGDTQPDVILAPYSGLTQEDYDTLSKIAPVVAFPELPWATSLDDMIEMSSEALGLEAEGDALITELDSQIETALAAHPELDGKKILFSFIDATDLSQIGFYTVHDTRPAFLADLGLPLPAVVEEESEANDEFYVTVSSEQADRFADVDVFVTYGDTDGVLIKQLQADPLLSKIPAIAHGAIAILPNSTPLASSANPSPLSIGWGIDEYFALLAGAVKGVTELQSTAPSSDAALLRRPTAVRLSWLLAGALVLLVLFLVSLAFGTRIVSVDEVLSALGGNMSGVGESAVVKRLPRTVLAVLVGAALALSGATMQAVTRNPLADPGILGVSSGAALAVVSGIAFFGLSDPFVYIWVAIGGAALAAVFVYTVGSLGRDGATPLKLALAGAAISATFSSLISAILLPRVDILTTFRFWQIGGVGGASWERVGLIIPFLLVGALIVVARARGMNTLALGDELATGLGENVLRTRLISSVGAVVLCGAATAIAGPIGFVGLVVPHFCRLLVGTDQRWLLPFSAITGAGLLVAADVVGRVVARPQEIEVGIITAIIGAPVFIWIVRRQKVREL